MATDEKKNKEYPADGIFLVKGSTLNDIKAQLVALRPRATVGGGLKSTPSADGTFFSLSQTADPNTTAPVTTGGGDGGDGTALEEREWDVIVNGQAAKAKFNSTEPY